MKINHLTEHCTACPHLELQDVFKFLHQSCFGCEHMVASRKDALERIIKELERTQANTDSLIQPLDGEYSRVPLSYINKGLNPDTLAGLFYLSAKHEPDGLQALEKKLDDVRKLIKDELLPFDPKNFEEKLTAWKGNGYPALHHSDTFNSAYRPSYRVISNRFIPFLSLFTKIDTMLATGRVYLAIEGSSASGKSTLAELLSQLYDCTVFHMDDFFLQPHQRTPQRFSQPGGNADRERFLQEVLIPMSKGEEILYRRFDCSTLKTSQPITIVPKRLTVIEGAYCMHPELAGYYNLTVMLDISPEKQRERILKRNSPHMAKRFFEEWIPLENSYFEHFAIKEKCGMIISVI